MPKAGVNEWSVSETDEQHPCQQYMFVERSSKCFQAKVYMKNDMMGKGVGGLGRDIVLGLTCRSFANTARLAWHLSAASGMKRAAVGGCWKTTRLG